VVVTSILLSAAMAAPVAASAQSENEVQFEEVIFAAKKGAVLIQDVALSVLALSGSESLPTLFAKNLSDDDGAT
jgi:hypothetical protein